MNRHLYFIVLLCNFPCITYCQNVGLGIATPAAKLHVKGSENIPQLVIDAGNNQNNFQPLFKLRTGNGSDLLWLNADNSSNIFLGVNAGRENDRFNSNNFNNFIGFETGIANSTGGYNAINGSLAFHSNTTGSYNSASGFNSLYRNTTGDFNTAYGSNSLFLNINGSNNTAIGNSALYANVSGQANVGCGSFALNSATTAIANTGVGHFALYSNSFGQYNTAVGAYSLRLTTTAQYNTAIGYNAGANYDMGYNNTILGANCDVNQAGIFNGIAIGQAVTVTASSQARIGNPATNSIGGYANWTNISDGRFKKDIQQNVKGIDFILRLTPVTYHLDITGLGKMLDEARGKEPDEFSRQAIAEKEKIMFSGFIAQEVEKAAEESGYDFSGVDKPKNDKDLYGLRYAEFVVPLVKAVQEQQEMITVMQKRIALLEEQNKMLQTVLKNK